MIAHGPVGTVVLDDEQIQRGDAAFLREADLRAPHHAGPRAADVVLLLSADAHHHRGAGLLREQRRNHHRHGAGALAAEPAAAVLADQDNVRRVDAQPARQRIQRARDALGRPVQEQLPVLPVRHRTAGLHRLMAGGLHDERFVDDQRRAPESSVEITVRPLFGRLPIGRPPSGASAKSRSVHFSVWILGRGGGPPLAPPGAGGAGNQTLPSVRPFAPDGRRLSTGSTTKGSASKSTSIFSIASAAVRSSTAASARIGSPWYNGSLVSAFSAPRRSGTSSAVRIALTPGVARADRVSMRRTRACGIGLSSSFVNSMPSAR